MPASKIIIFSKKSDINKATKRLDASKRATDSYQKK